MGSMSENSTSKVGMRSYELLQRRRLDLQQAQLFIANGRITRTMKLTVVEGLQQSNVAEIGCTTDHDVEARHFVTRSIINIQIDPIVTECFALNHRYRHRLTRRERELSAAHGFL